MPTVLDVRQELFDRLSRFALSNRRDMKKVMPEIFRDGRFRPMANKFNNVLQERKDEAERVEQLKELAEYYGLKFQVR